MQYSPHLLRYLRFTIGQNIQQQRVRQQLPLRKLSRLSGVPEHLLDQYELGKNEIRLEDMLKITCALGLEVGTLIT